MVETPTVNVGLRVPLAVYVKLLALAQSRRVSINKTATALLVESLAKYPVKEGA